MATEKRSVSDRIGVLGCSDIGAIYNASPYKTARDVAKTYLGEDEKNITPKQQEALNWGHWLEPHVADLIKQVYGMRLKETQNRYLYKKDPRFGCHPDRFVIGHPDEAVEIKTSTAFDMGRWGEEDTDEVPYDYLLQCYGYYICIPRLNKVYLFRFSNNRLTRYIIRRPEQSVLDEIGAHLTEWMDKVDSGWLPEVRKFDEAVKEFIPREGSAEAPAEIMALLGEYSGYSDQIKMIEQKQEIIKLSLLKYLEDQKVSTLYDPDYNKSVCSYVKVERSSIDSKKLKEELPEIAETYTKITAYNQLKISKPKLA